MSIFASIKSIEYFLPEKVLTNEILAQEIPGWDPFKIAKKTGIVERRIASNNECSSDLGVYAAQKLIKNSSLDIEEIDYILFCTQTPDYFLPTTACIIQDRLGIPKNSGAIDFNQGCSGYVYGLGLAKSLIETEQARKVLLITGETYSKLLDEKDTTTRSIFGDGGTATLLEASSDNNSEFIGPFVYGTDGSRYQDLILQKGGFRKDKLVKSEKLFMHGGNIFSFTIKMVPNSIKDLLEKSKLQKEDIDLFIPHQANEYILRSIQNKVGIDDKKIYINMKKIGNTVSSSIPIAIKNASEDGLLNGKKTLMLIGFGVGLSWASAIIKIKGPIL